MSFRATHADADAYVHYEADTGGYQYASEELVSGERICAPRGEPRGSTMLSAIFVISIACGLGWTYLKNKDAVDRILSAAPSLFALSDNPDVQPSTASPVSQQPQPLPLHDVVDAPGLEAGTPVPSASAPAPASPDAAVASQSADEDSASTEPLPPPVVDPANPYQKRAAAVGLHPDISQALLKKLTPTDFRNANTAIATALAETPDTDIYAWPRPQQANLAFFEVKFVKGAAADCRRYVVTVTKDRWSTTAPPMEKCGLKPPVLKTKAAAKL